MESEQASAVLSRAGTLAYVDLSIEKPQSSNKPVEVRKPAPLRALTGLRSFAAINIVFFHFSNPLWFGWLAPVVNAGYASVSYFILLSGFVLGYNYNARARAGELDKVRFYKARFTRLYPIYLLSLLLAWRVLPQEYAAHTPLIFWTGIVLSPLLLQGWIPSTSTFLNTPAWTMSAEAFYYVLFPWMARWKRPKRVVHQLWKMGGVWILGLIPGALYIIFNPDGIPHPDRWSYGPWLQALKYTPLPHLASFVFGVLLADWTSLCHALGVCGFCWASSVLRRSSRCFPSADRCPTCCFTMACSCRSLAVSCLGSPERILWHVHWAYDH